MTPTPTPTPFVPNIECWSDEHVPLDSEVIVVPDYTCNEPNDTMYLQKYTKLRRLIVGDYSYKYLRVINLTKMYELESVEIGANSFWNYDYHAFDNFQFYMEDCPRVAKLTIGEHSLLEYNTFVVKNCSSLIYIETGRSTAMSSEYTLFENLPVLKSMLIGYWSFACTHENESRSITFRDLPALESIVTLDAHNLDPGSFYYARQLIVEGLPRLDQLDLHSKSFVNVNVWRTDCNVGAFLPYFEDQCSGPTWWFLVDGTAAPDGWNTVQGAQNWLSSKGGVLPPTEGITSYYYTRFNGADANSYALMDVIMNVSAGAVAYLNGREIRRVNLPAGEIDATTLATAVMEDNPEISTSVRVRDGWLNEGENILAFEMHSNEMRGHPNHFDARIRYIASGTNLITDGTGTTVPLKPGKEGTAQLFDGNVDTKLCVGKGGKVNVTATWTYKSDRRVIVNTYGLTSANDCNFRHPSGWEFVASNDGKTWDVLDVRSGEFFTAPHQEKTFDIENSKPYNIYQYNFYEFKNPAFSSGVHPGCETTVFQLSKVILSVYDRVYSTDATEEL